MPRHTAVGDLSDALTALPDLSSDGDDHEQARATGTDDAVPADEACCTSVVRTTPDGACRRMSAADGDRADNSQTEPEAGDANVLRPKGGYSR